MPSILAYMYATTSAGLPIDGETNRNWKINNVESIASTVEPNNTSKQTQYKHKQTGDVALFNLDR